MQLNDILMIFGLSYCILTLSLFCRISVIAKNLALFGVKLFCLKFGSCKETDILKLWSDGIRNVPDGFKNVSDAIMNVSDGIRNVAYGAR